MIETVAAFVATVAAITAALAFTGWILIVATEETQ